MKKYAKFLLSVCLAIVLLATGVFYTLAAQATSESASTSIGEEAAGIESTSITGEAEPEVASPESVTSLPESETPAAPQAEAGPVQVSPLGVATQITPVYPIASTTQDPSPVFIFNSPVEGTIQYQGGWASATQTVVQGENLIEFNPMPNGYYENCSLTITASGGTVINWAHPAFKIEAPARASLWGHINTFGFDYDQRVHSNPVEAAWLATHHDIIVGASAANEMAFDTMKAANPGVLLIGYISMQVGPEIWLENWATENGYDPEDLYYHYYYDTQVRVQKEKVVIPGWGGGSATSRRAARAVTIYGGYSPMCPTSPLFVKAYSAYAMHLLSVNPGAGKYLDGLFIDGYDLITQNYSLERTIEARNRYGELDAETANVLLSKEMASMRDQMEMRASAIISRDIRIMGIASEADYPNGDKSHLFSDLFNTTYNEVAVEYLTKPIRTRQHDIKALKGLYDNMEAGNLVLANSETAWPTRFRSPDDPTDDWSESTWFNYSQHMIATHYLLAHTNGYFGYHAGSASYYGGLNGTLRETHWNINYEYNVGSPIVHGKADYWGTVGTNRFYTFEKGGYRHGYGYAYEILAREFEYALVISKFGGDTYPQIGRDPLTHQLGGQYRRLLADNTLGPIITEITLGQGEGALLIKLDENGNPLSGEGVIQQTPGGGGAPASSSKPKPSYGKNITSSSSSASIVSSSAPVSSSSASVVPIAFQGGTTATPLAAPAQGKPWLIILAVVIILLVLFLLALIIGSQIKKRRQSPE